MLYDVLAILMVKRESTMPIGLAQTVCANKGSGEIVNAMPTNAMSVQKWIFQNGAVGVKLWQVPCEVTVPSG